MSTAHGQYARKLTRFAVLCILIAPPILLAQLPSPPQAPRVDVQPDRSVVVTYQTDFPSSVTGLSLAATFNGAVIPGSPFPVGRTGTVATGPLSPGSYTVELVVSTGAGSLRSPATAFVIGGPTDLGPPTLQAPDVRGNTVTITWLPAVGQVTGYELQATVEATGQVLQLLVPAQTSVTVDNVPAGSYALRVRAIAGATPGPYSNVVQLVVGGAAVETFVYANRYDSRVFGVRMPGSGTVDVSGPKDATGSFTALTNATVVGNDGRERRAGFDANGRIDSLTLTGGIDIDLAWRDAANATLAVRVDGRPVGSVPVTLGDGPSPLPVSQPDTEHTPLPANEAPSRTIFVQVTNTCGRAVTNAAVDVEVLRAPYSSILRIPWSGSGSLYTGNAPNGPDPLAGANAKATCEKLGTNPLIIWGANACTEVGKGLTRTNVQTVVKEGVFQVGILAQLAGLAEGAAVAAAAAEAGIAATLTCLALKVRALECTVQGKIVDIGEEYFKGATLRPIVRVPLPSGTYAVPGPGRDLATGDLTWVFNDVPCSAPLTGTWVGIYRYGAECQSYQGVETLDLTEDADGNVKGTLVDTTLTGTPVARGDVSGTRDESDVKFTGTYTGSFQGRKTSFKGTLKGTQLAGTLTGACGLGATVTFSKQ